MTEDAVLAFEILGRQRHRMSDDEVLKFVRYFHKRFTELGIDTF